MTKKKYTIRIRTIELDAGEVEVMAEAIMIHQKPLVEQWEIIEEEEKDWR